MKPVNFQTNYCFSDLEDLYKIVVIRLIQSNAFYFHDSFVCFFFATGPRGLGIKKHGVQYEMCPILGQLFGRLDMKKEIYMSNVIMGMFASVRLLCGKTLIYPQNDITLRDG